jgi:Ca2+-binding RTX toxin-like protein
LVLAAGIALTLALVGAPLAVAAPPELTATVALMDNPTYTDTSVAGGESDNVQASLAAQGHSVTTFTDISAAGFTAALAGKDVLLIPEQETMDLAPDLSEAARNVIRDFVSRGGRFVINGDHSFGGADNDGAAQLLNSLFGFSTTEASALAGPYAKTAAAGGTQFSAGPATLPLNNGTNGLSKTSLPAGARSLYEDATQSVVTLFTHGSGSVIFLGWDWFNSNPPNAGGQDGGWQIVLDLAVALLPGACTNPRIGTAGNDTLTGRRAGDRIEGLAGNDLLSGLDGDDCLEGDQGNDQLLGGTGNDVLAGDSGKDKLKGDDGDDQLAGSGGKDRLVGGSGKNRYSAGGGNDRVKAKNGTREKVNCGAGRRDVARVDRIDRTQGCERVLR